MIEFTVFCALVPLVLSAITEIPLPTNIQQCFEQELLRSDNATMIGEVVYLKCVRKTLIGHPMAEQAADTSLGNDAMNWISGLVHMDFHNPEIFGGAGGRPKFRHRRQTGRGGDRFPADRVGDRQFSDGRQISDTRRFPDEGRTSEITFPDSRLRDQSFSGDRRVDRRPTDSRPTNGRQTLRRQPRVRKEYRMLTDRERQLFHRALNMLKSDTSVSPNKYDALARLHYISVGRSHYGPNFLPWHRLFLVVMENALREKIPSVTIPYWDSTLDDGLLDPRSSIIWTPEFLGEANGYVEDGPFAFWDTQTGPLIRYFGTAGTLMNWTYIYNVFRQNHLENITDPYGLPDNNLELHHTQVHNWVGGHMAPPALAAFDPVFYMLHSYVDLLWEIFRGLQKRRGIDPTTDFPRNNTDIPNGQRYDDPSGFGSLLNRHGLSNVFTDNIYKYDRPPSCTMQNQDCGSRYLKCDTSDSQPKCVSASIFDIKPLFLSNGLPMEGGSGIREFRRKRQTHIGERWKQAQLFDMMGRLSNVQCQSSNVNEKYVNDFAIDGVVDKQSWAFIPVQVVYKNINTNTTNMNLETVYDICKRENTKIPSRIFTESNGMNYVGLYKEISHFPDDVTTSSSLTYIGARKPVAHAYTDILVSAYDECGNICQPYCLDSTGKKSNKCPGAVRISSDSPLLYGNDVSEVESNIWKEDKNGLPYLDESGIFLTLVCDRRQSFWPW